MTEAKIRKWRATVMNLPYANTAPALSGAANVKPGACSAKVVSSLEKFKPPMAVLINGMARSSTMDSTILPNALPMITSSVKFNTFLKGQKI
jgi:hypothetical protein